MLLCSTLAIWCATVFKRKNTWLVSIWTTTLDDKKVILMVLFPHQKYQLLFVTVTHKTLMFKSFWFSTTKIRNKWLKNFEVEYLTLPTSNSPWRHWYRYNKTYKVLLRESYYKARFSCMYDEKNKDHKFHSENKLVFTTVITFYAATVFPFSLNISSISINLSRAPWLIMLLCSTLAIRCATVLKWKNTWLVSVWTTTTLDDKKR